MASYQMNYLGFATVDKRLSSPMLPWIIAQIKRAGTNQEVHVPLSLSSSWATWDPEKALEQNSKPIFLVNDLYSEDGRSFRLRLSYQYKVEEGFIFTRTIICNKSFTDFPFFKKMLKTTFVENQWENTLTTEDLRDAKVYLSFDAKCYYYSITNKWISCLEVEDYKNHQEEADTGIVLHAVCEVRASLGKCCLELQGDVRLTHQLALVARLGVYPEGDGGYLVYAVRDRDLPLLYCHLLHSSDIHHLLELMASMKELQSRVKTPTSLCPDISPSSSHFFEVLYIGRIKVSHKKVPDTFIDEALDRFKIFERQRKERENLGETRLANAIIGQASTTYASSDTLHSEDITESVAVTRQRSGSLGTVLAPTDKTQTGSKESLSHEYNRTMVFHVGRTDLRLISPDRKQVLLHKYLRDITSSLQGCRHSSHFAFVSKEPSTDNNSNYVGYVFKCESPSVAEDIVSELSQKCVKVKHRWERRAEGEETPAISQASVSDKKTSVVSCEGCPMVWYHRLCMEMEASGQPQESLRRRLDSLPQEEAAIVRTKLEGGGAGSESIEVTMMLLRAHCEAKQARHIHDTLETRHEFLSQYLGGNAIFLKAKRSLTSSFDQLLKRKGSRDDLHHSVSLPHNASLCKDLLVESPTKSTSETDAPEEPGTPGSMMNIFMKLGKPSPKTPSMRPRSWRQAIYNNVVTPNKTLQKDGEKKTGTRDRGYYKDLWKKAINQQVLLIRMEKENAQLTARQEEATVKRIKLEYEEVGTVGACDTWEKKIQETSTPPSCLSHSLKYGIPKMRRGDVWKLLAERCEQVPPDPSEFPHYDLPYEELLKQLTSHQHAILIDLGRTFPNHPYYSSPLGPGQLSLFNILKAYSLVDPGVGYCQGLSFPAGLLLLHMPEADAFYLLRHLMFSKGLRERYLPDMSALQVCLYQLSRLLHDLHPDLYDHFDSLDIAPSLYAAPWLLTLFSSQFSLGFVARVFDLIFVDSPQVLFKVAIALLGYHKEQLLACTTFEEVMDYLKLKLPNVPNHTMDYLVKEVVETDVSRELKDYGVEYHVLEEEMSSPRPELKRIKELELENQALADQVLSLQRQLQMSVSDVKRMESTRGDHVSQLNRAEGELEELRSEFRALKSDMVSLSCYIAESLDSPGTPIPNHVYRIFKQHNINLLTKNKGELKTQVSCPELTPTASSNIGRVLTDAERRALVQSRQAALERVKKPVQSALELGASLKHHPLDSEDVVTSFEGTVRLKSLPPPLRRAETVAQGGMLKKAEVLQAVSDEAALRRAESLRIVESRDAVAAKIRSTKDRVSRLFEFEKPFGKQTQMLIKSQALQKSNSLLT